MLNLSINTQGFNSFSRKVSPFLMFNNGAEGGLYPISDLKRQGKLYTDSALSTVLTDAGDPLGGANDLSGNGNALTQATDTDRPVVRQEADGNWSVEFNYTNQYLSSSYPAGTYTVCLAGINGAWFDEIEHAGGAFDLGPTTFSSTNPDTDPDAPARLYGPEGILEVVGNVVAFIPMEGSITSAQKARLLQYLAQLGCPGEITLGPATIGNPNYENSGDGWGSTNATPVWGVDQVEVAVSADFGLIKWDYAAPEPGAGKYLLDVEVLATSTGGDIAAANVYDTSNGVVGGSGILKGPGERLSFVSTINNNLRTVQLRCSTSGESATYGPVSMRKLEFPA